MSSSESVAIQRLLIHINPEISIEQSVQQLHDVASTVNGYAGTYWGRLVEDPTKCEILCCKLIPSAHERRNKLQPIKNFIFVLKSPEQEYDFMIANKQEITVWKSLAHQDKFPETHQRHTTDRLFMQMSTRIPKCHYLPPQPWRTLLIAPVVEMLSFSKLQSTINPSVFKPLIEYIRGTDGCLNVMGAPTTQFGDGVDQKRFLIVVAWESVEAHERGKKAEGFATLPKELWLKAEVHHVRWNVVETSQGQLSVQSKI
jgi:heme-degrading monooxygenase HmoA